MNTLRHVSALILLLFAAHGCTLMFDEQETETSNSSATNGDGITAPRTEETELGSVTYQFNEGVRIIDEKYLPYIVSCRMDTAAKRTEICLTDNIPGDLLPQRGEYIGTTMAEMFSYTLSDQVDAVTKSGRGILVVSHAVSLNKIFKQLDCKISAYIASEETADSVPVRSAGSASRRRLVLKPTRTKTRDMEADEKNKLVSVMLTSQDDEGKDYDFQLANGQNYSILKKIGTFQTPIPTVKTGIEGKGKVYTAMGIESVQKLDVDFSLTDGLKIDLDNTIHRTYGISAETLKGYMAVPIVGNTGASVPKDRIFGNYEWKKLEHEIRLPDIELAATYYKVVKLSVFFNFSISYDTSFDIKSDKPFVYEWEETLSLYHWSLETSKDFKTNIERQKTNNIKDADNYGNIGNGYFKTGWRVFGHFELGLSLGMSDPTEQFFGFGFTPFKLNGDASLTHIIYNDYNGTKPSVLDKNGVKYYATDKSSDTRRLAWTESLATGVGLSGLIYDSTDYLIGDYLDYFSYLSLSLSTEPKSFVLWQSSDQAFPTTDLELTYQKGLANANYSATLKVLKANSFILNKDYGSEWDDNYRDIQLLVFDENYKYIKSATPSDPKYPEYKDCYPYLSYGRSYPFEFALSYGELAGSKYFYLVPAFACGYTQTRTGMTPVFVPTNNLFTKPYKYNSRFDRGTIGQIQPLWVENDDKYCKPGYCLDGIAIDADCSFNHFDVSRVYTRIEFYDTDGRLLMGKEFEYALGTGKAGNIKAVYLINHRLETVVGKAKVTLYYYDYDTTTQTSIDKESHKNILDEREYTFDDDTESWPVYDYINSASWTAKGYKLAY